MFGFQTSGLGGLGLGTEVVGVPEVALFLNSFVMEREPLGSTWLPTEPFPPGHQRALCGSIHSRPRALPGQQQRKPARSEVYPGRAGGTFKGGGQWGVGHKSFCSGLLALSCIWSFSSLFGLSGRI